jgi:hypothetical protein
VLPGLVLLAIVILIPTVGVLTLGGSPVGLGRLPKALYRTGAIDEQQFPAVKRSTRRLARWRLVGGLLGAGLSALFTLPAPGFYVGVLWVLTGAVAGMACAEWWRDVREPQALRSASLVRRSLTGLVGWTPVVLLCIPSIMGGLAAISLLVHPPQTGQINKTFLNSDGSTWNCSAYISPSGGFFFAMLLAAATIAVAIGAAHTATRRRADPALGTVADEILRAAAVRSAIGGAIVVAAGAAAALVGRFAETHSDTCDRLHGDHHLLYPVLDICAFGLVVLALVALSNYLFTPARVPTKRVRVRATKRLPVS